MNGSLKNFNILDYIKSPKSIEKDTPSEFNLNFFYERKFNSRELENHHKQTPIDFEKEKIDKISQKIRFLIKSNVNIALYGYGSKFDLLNIISTKFEDYHRLKISGFIPGITLKRIYDEFFKFFKSSILGISSSEIKIEEERVNSNEKAFERKFKGKKLRTFEDILDLYNDKSFDQANIPKILIIFHNIDSYDLRDSHIQSELSLMSKIPGVNLIASFDNTNYPILLPSKTFENFNFVFLEIHTRRLYINEFFYTENIFNPRIEKSRDSLKYIWRSLNSNQQHIVRILANWVLENPEKKGIPFNKFLSSCIEEACLSSDSQLKENLVELMDHKVIVEKKDEHNKKYYMMKYPLSVINKLSKDEFNPEEDLD